MFSAVLACLVTAPLFWAQASAKPPTAEEIAAAIAQLGDESFEVRQKATEWLWKTGPAAEPQLKAALKSTDPEVRTRAASVLDKLRFGLRPDTPPDVALLIDQFRHGGSLQARQQALTALQGKGQWAVILALLRGETDTQQRRRLAAAISADAGKLLRPLLAAEDLDQAEQVLELTAENEAGLAQLAAFLLLTERLGPRIEALKQKLSAEPQEGDWRRLAMFLRAKGDFSAAADAAAETSDVVFAAKVLAEAARFSQAGKLAEEFPKGATTWPDAPAFAAAWYELAGDEAGYGRVMQGLRQAVGLDKQPARPQAPVPADPFSQPTTSTPLNQAWRLAETLLIAERVELALEVLKKTHPVQAHALLVRQHRHSEALAYATVTADKVLDRQWFDSLPGGLGEAQQQAAVRFSLAAQVARELRDLGRPAQVEQVVETLRGLAAAESQKGARWSALAALAWRLERYDDAFSNAEQALAANQSPASVFAPLLSKAGPLAAAWFSEAINRDPLTDRKAAIAQAVWLVVAQPPAGKLPANWRELVLQAAEQARKFPPAERGAKLMLPADICRLRGELALARKLYEEAGESFPAAALKAADVAALENDWTAAASIYGKLSAANNSDALALLLHGHALEKSGQAEEGAKKMRLASLTALAPDVRYTLATGLQERGLEELAAEQFELVRRTALPDSVISVNAAQRVGNLVHQKEPARATDCWRQLHLHILNSSSIFLESEGYLSLPQIMHKVRARAALAAGQRDVLQAELDRCEKLLPGDVRLVVELVPKLDAAGLADVSEKLLQRGLAAHQLVLEEFPDSPSYLNNAAWITARAQRRLDEGLALIERALKIAPDEASYHDTLAEIQFQRGDRDAAVAAAKKAVELSPHSKLFAARLKHFQEDAVKTLDTVNE